MVQGKACVIVVGGGAGGATTACYIAKDSTDAIAVTLSGGGTLSYDRPVLSPGTGFVGGSVEGWDLTAQNICVLGDACAHCDMRKSGFSANSQAKVAAMAVRAALTG